MKGWEWLRGIAPVSLCDWPERVCSVLFFGGCNLRCPTCHNQAVAWYPEILPKLAPETVMDTLRQRRKWLDGIVLTGGEPLVVQGIEDVLKELRSLELPLKVDSNGMRPDLIQTFLEQGLADCFAVDIKGPWEKYAVLTGGCATTEQARERLGQIFSLAEKYPEKFYFRCTRVPCLTDDDLTVARSYLPAGFSLTVQKYVEPVVVDGKDTGPDET